MHSFGRVAATVALTLGATALSACYAPATEPPPPPAAAVAPEPALPPPPSPLATTPPAAPDYAAAGTPFYGSTAPAVLAPSDAGTTAMVAPYAPPPPRVETPPAAPSPLAMWQLGHWSWNGSQFVWVSGHYVMRPSATATWRPGYWQQSPAGWTWIEGSWS